MDTFGSRLRKRARELKLTDAEVARRAGLSERRYGNYVTGTREPDFGTLTRLCTVLDTDPNVLLGFDTHQPSKREVVEGRIRASASALDDRTAVILAELADSLVRHTLGQKNKTR